MKKTLLLMGLGGLLLSSCGGPTVPASATLQTQALGLTTSAPRAFGNLFCPPSKLQPYWHLCGILVVQARVGMGGNIIPADLLVTGDKEAAVALGQSFKLSLPVQAGKVNVGNALWVPDSVDKSLWGLSGSFDFSSANLNAQGQWQFSYKGTLSP